MNINIEECDDKLLVKVSLVPYNVGRRNPQVIRETCDYNKVEKILLKKGYKGYTPHNKKPSYKIDNKFTSLDGTFSFSKRKTKKINELEQTKILDSSEKPVLKYPKRKRSRKSSISTDEQWRIYLTVNLKIGISVLFTTK